MHTYICIHIFVGSMDKKLKPVDLENIEENRRRYREMLFTCDPKIMGDCKCNTVP